MQPKPQLITPLSSKEKPQKPKKSNQHSWWKLLLLATVVVGLSGYGLGTWLSSGDHLSQREITERKVAFDSLRDSQHTKANIVPQSKIDSIIEQMPLSSPKEKEYLKNSLATGSGDIRLVELTLWDDLAPDGDVVSLSSAGYSQEILLSKTPQTIHFPVETLRPVMITGIRDGGGITLGFVGSGQPVMLPVLIEGESIGFVLK
ncbi:hypothetical protein [Stenoxybacter acetivorans]|uniref:hypothetical protein n=1 Tax=Stenoxybacter acetivorans TaxID=422441 RepID=UPI0005648270|nr:hypothetical protein [Stenoxybacter acetivorans]